MRENLADTLRLLLVTDDALLGARDPVAVCQAAVRGGVTAVQLRLKLAGARELLQLARRLLATLSVPLFVNDRLDVALAAGAAGVHLGPDDLAPALARRIVPPGFVIGASVGSVGEIERGTSADYWGIGPLRATRTKHDAGAPLAMAGAKLLLAAAAGRPAVLIGGVRPEDFPLAIAAGFAGVAAAGAILADVDVERAARRFGASLAPS